MIDQKSMRFIEDIQEPDIEKLNRSLEKNGIKVEKRDDYSTIKGYHLVDIVKGKLNVKQG